MFIRPGIIVIFLLLFSFAAYSQNRTNDLVSAIDSFHTRVPREKLFLHLNKPNYNIDDTIWMKAYVLNDALGYSAQSGLLYIELINDSDKVVARYSMPVKLGISFGQIVLDGKIVTQGSYTLRAYTNWMQNIGATCFFTRQIYISNANNGSWLVHKAARITNNNGRGHIDMAMRFARLNKSNLSLREMLLQVKAGDKILRQANVETDIEGKLNVNFDLPAKVDNKHLTVNVQDMRKGSDNQKLVIPIVMDRFEETDLQFMPEGGQMVAGLPCKVAFKAIGEDGKGKDVSGTIVNSKGKIIAPFKSGYKGMGAFKITPDINETYVARLNLPGGGFKTYALPAVAAIGIAMHVVNPDGKDSLLVSISATAGIRGMGKNFSLIGQARGKVCFASHFSFADSVVSGWVAKDKFPSGIARFTIFDDGKIPVAERSVFINHNDSLAISINTGNKNYRAGDSVVLHIKVTDKNNDPVSGSFSMAINDDDEVKPDSSYAGNLYNYMLLSADLQGDIESPGYYFDAVNANRYDALDNLLLTQGWANYSWKDVFDKQYKPAFMAVPEIEVTGKISRTGGKAVNGLPVYLLSIKRPELIMDTISGNDGRFVFKGLPRIDTVNFMLSVKDKSGRAFEARIAADEFKPADAEYKSMAPLTPWYVNTDSALLHYTLNKIAYDNELDKIKYPAGIRHIKEVVIKGRRMIKGSQWLAANGVPDVVLNEDDMKKANKMTLEEILYKMIPAFGITSLPCGCYEDCDMDYEINCHRVALSIDGFAVDRNYQAPGGFSPSAHYYYLRSYLTTLTAEDIKGIELMNRGYNDGVIEVTTWSGQGAFLKRMHGTYLYRPMPVTWPKQFYRPKYSVKENTLENMRATILWEPDLITDKDGKAKITLYTKSKPATYTITIEGSDLSSTVGYKSMKLAVK